jgi:hypothetical protein
MAFTLKQGDRRPLFVVALKDNFGEVDEAAVDLTTACSALFNMRAEGGGATKINRGSAAITTAASGIVTYSWGTADVDTVGTYEAEMEILWNDGKAETFPNDSYWTVEIVDDIA